MLIPQYVLKVRGEAHYYRAPGEFTTDIEAARVCHRAMADALALALPFAVDAVEHRPWYTGLAPRRPFTHARDCRFAGMPHMSPCSDRGQR